MDALRAVVMYFLKSLPLVTLAVVMALSTVPEAESVDYQLRIPSKDGVHMLDMSKGFTRAILAPNGSVHVLDRVRCSIHNEDEIFARPVGYWSVDGSATASTPEELLRPHPLDGPGESLDYNYGP